MYSHNVKDILSQYIEYLIENPLKYPISGLDYSSLYPSLIMAYNLSPEYLILDRDYKEEIKNKGYEIHDINFEYKYVNYLQEKCVKHVKGWTVRHDESKEKSNFGLYPSILKNLFAQRAEMKKELFIYKEKKEHIEKYETDYINNEEYKECLFKLNYCDTKQKALKVFMNTFYGELGNKNSPLFILELAGAITSAGQKNLLLIKDYVERLNHNVYYGDSVTGDTPILIRENGKDLKLIAIEEYGWNNLTNSKNKEFINEDNLPEGNPEIYTENGWTPIKKMIRHFTTKKLYKVNTHIGSIIVTEDHSLINTLGKKITPNEVNLETELMHWDKLYINDKNTKIKFHDIHKKINNLPEDYSIDELKDTIVLDIAFVYGFFFGDGSCGYYDCESGKKYSFVLNNSNLKYLDVCLKIFNSYYKYVQLKIYDTLESYHVYKAIANGNVKRIVSEWRDMFYSERRYKKVPDIILNADSRTKIAFMQGYYLANGDTNCNRMDNKGQIGSQGLFLLMDSLGYNVSINTRSDKLELYRLRFTTNKFRKNVNKIKKIEYIGETGQYVYDLETESHHFAAGVGKMVVHNTDSLYISCPESYYLEKNKEYYTGKINKLQYNTDLITITFKAIEDIKVKVNNYLYKDNGTKYLKMSYEEVLYPMVLLAKKKYYGIPHENIPNFKPAEMFIRGLEVKKRGVSEILKIICLDIMWESLDLKNTKTLRELVITKIKEIFVTDWKLEDFIQTGLWKPEKQNVTLNEFSKRMIEENKPHLIPGERFNYVIIKKYPYKYDFKGRQIPLKKADKMEYFDIVNQDINKSYEIDLKYYFDKQLTGQFARLISYDNEFTEYGIDPETNEVEVDDDKTLNKCKKYILQLADMHGNKYIDRNKVFKNIYKVVDNKYKEVVKKANISKSESYNKKYKLLFNSNYKNTEDELNLFKMITYNVENYLDTSYNFSILSNKIIKKCDDSSMIKLFNGKNTSFYKKQQSFLNISFGSKLDSLIKYIIDNKLENTIFNIDNVNVINLIQYFRKKFNIDDIVNTDKEIESFTDIIDENELDNEMINFNAYAQIDPIIIKKIYNDYINLISIKKNIILNQHIFNNLYIKKSSTSDYSVKPHGFKF
jgi:hypothetical protein